MEIKKIGVGMLAIALVFEIVLSGCATTTMQITFSATESPQGELKYAVVNANSMSGDSVLQRFYAEYPHEKYRVVACELVSKSWLPPVIGGALLGAVIGIPAAQSSSDLAVGMGVGFGLPVVGASIGWLLGSLDMSKYIVTYVEIGEPEAPVSKPKAQVLKPEVQVSKPEVQVSKPEAQGPKPETQVSKPKAPVSKPKAQGSKPKTQGSKPKTQR
jgi:hypothetical protein